MADKRTACGLGTAKGVFAFRCRAHTVTFGVTNVYHKIDCPRLATRR
jgi:hypothetical protein